MHLHWKGVTRRAPSLVRNVVYVEKSIDGAVYKSKACVGQYHGNRSHNYIQVGSYQWDFHVIRTLRCNNAVHPLRPLCAFCPHLLCRQDSGSKECEGGNAWKACKSESKLTTGRGDPVICQESSLQHVLYGSELSSTHFRLPSSSIVSASSVLHTPFFNPCKF